MHISPQRHSVRNWILVVAASVASLAVTQALAQHVPKGIRGEPCKSGQEGCNPASTPSTGQSHRPTGGSSSGQSTQQIINGLNAFSASMARIYARERAERERKQAEEAQWNARRQQWQEENRNQQMQATGGNSPTLQPAPGKADPTFQPLDPTSDFVGKECKYFTKPSVSADGARLNYYADGATVVYGKWAYRCKNRRWEKYADGAGWPSKYWAEKIEFSGLSTDIYEKD